MRDISLQNFMDYVYPEPNTGCWLWGGATTKSGYGDMWIVANGVRINRAHRISYFLHNGAFDFSMHILHKCDNRCCVNPSHLYLGTHQQNIADRESKGRGGAAYGEKNYAHILTEGDVNAIRKSGMSARQAANEYNISYFTAWDVIKGRSWRHLL